MQASTHPADSSTQLVNLLGMGRERLGKTLEPWVDRPFRVDQVYRGLYEQNLSDFKSMTSLSKALRQQLAEHFTLERPRISSSHRSEDGTVKYLLELEDGATIETVDIPEGRRRTLCLSSQAGCALACRFCVTGYWGGGRNLTSGEIVGQVLQVRDLRPGEHDGLNLVFMGMGEPLLNLESLEEALQILFESISWQRITVSTAGVIPGIEAMINWPKRPQLAISLHAADEERRTSLMPINRRYPLRDLLATLKRYPLAPRQTITFEYILIRDFNDSLGDADLLARRLKGLRAKVNLIPLNPDPVLDESMKPPSPDRVAAFQQRLRSRGLMATTRKQRGDDVSAACGQLRAFGRDPRGFMTSR